MVEGFAGDMPDRARDVNAPSLVPSVMYINVL